MKTLPKIQIGLTAEQAIKRLKLMIRMKVIKPDDPLFLVSPSHNPIPILNVAGPGVRVNFMDIDFQAATDLIMSCEVIMPDRHRG